MSANRESKISMVVGSLILGLLKTMDINQQHKGSTIAYTTLMRKHISRFIAPVQERKELADVCRDSMLQLVEQFEGQESIMQVATFVESLSFSFEKELTQFFGADYMNKMIKFTDKQVVDSSLAKDSYALSDQLRNNIRKIIFDNLKVA